MRAKLLWGFFQVFPQIGEFDRDVVKTAMAQAAVYGFSPTKVAKVRRE